MIKKTTKEIYTQVSDAIQELEIIRDYENEGEVWSEEHEELHKTLNAFWDKLRALSSFEEPNLDESVDKALEECLEDAEKLEEFALTADEKLDEVMQARKWYGDTINPGTARSYKNLHKNRKLSKDKVISLLNLLGHYPKQEESW